MPYRNGNSSVIFPILQKNIIFPDHMFVLLRSDTPMPLRESLLSDRKQRIFLRTMIVGLKKIFNNGVVNILKNSFGIRENNNTIDQVFGSYSAMLNVNSASAHVGIMLIKRIG